MPPGRSGIAQHGAHLVDALEAAGHQVHVECWRRQYPRLLTRRQEADEGGCRPGAVRRLRWWNPIGWWAAGRRLRGSDVVVVPWVTAVQAPALAVIRRAAGRPTVAIVHNVEPHERIPFTEPLLRLALRGSHHAVVHADAVADELRAVIPELPVRAVGMPSLVDVDRTPLPDRPPLRLLCLGMVRPYKGVDLAIEAIGVVRRRGLDVRLTVAGEIWQGEPELRGLVERLGLEDRVEFVARWIPDEEVSSLVAGHHAVLATYRSASQSGVVALALAGGRPALVTPVGGLAEAVRDGVDGVVAGAASADAVANAIHLLDERCEQLAEGASTGPSWERVAEVVVG